MSVCSEEGPWTSKKQRTVALYIALTEETRQLHWLRRSLHDFGFSHTSIVISATPRSDRAICCYIPLHTTYPTRTTHSAQRTLTSPTHFIRERVASNEASLTYVEGNLSGYYDEGTSGSTRTREVIGFTGASYRIS